MLAVNLVFSLSGFGQHTELHNNPNTFKSRNNIILPVSETILPYIIPDSSVVKQTQTRQTGSNISDSLKLMDQDIKILDLNKDVIKMEVQPLPVVNKY
jgi:hypothetical protein